MINFGRWNYIYYLDFLANSFEMDLISLLVILAAMTRSAQIPFSSWFSLLYIVQTGSGTHPFSNPMGPGDLSPQVNLIKLQQLVYRSRKRGSIYPLSHTPSWRSVKHKDNSSLKKKKLSQGASVYSENLYSCITTLPMVSHIQTQTRDCYVDKIRANVGFEVLTALMMKSTIFWVVTEQRYNPKDNVFSVLCQFCGYVLFGYKKKRTLGNEYCTHTKIAYNLLLYCYIRKLLFDCYKLLPLVFVFIYAKPLPLSPKS
jgi:hypothetical protein